MQRLKQQIFQLIFEPEISFALENEHWIENTNQKVCFYFKPSTYRTQCFFPCTILVHIQTLSGNFSYVISCYDMLKSYHKLCCYLLKWTHKLTLLMSLYLQWKIHQFWSMQFLTVTYEKFWYLMIIGIFLFIYLIYFHI